LQPATHTGFVLCEYIEYAIEVMKQLETPKTHNRAVRALHVIRTHLTSKHHTHISTDVIKNAVKNGHVASVHRLASTCIMLHLAPAYSIPTIWFRFLHETLLVHIRTAMGPDDTMVPVVAPPVSSSSSSSAWSIRIGRLRTRSPQLFESEARAQALTVFNQYSIARILARLYFLWNADEFETRLSSSIEWCMRYLTLTHGSWATVLAAYHVFFMGTPHLFRDEHRIDTPQLRRIFNPLNTTMPHGDFDLFRATDFSAVEASTTTTTACIGCPVCDGAGLSHRACFDAGVG
jgi:hypothetical protein